MAPRRAGRRAVPHGVLAPFLASALLVLAAGSAPGAVARAVEEGRPVDEDPCLDRGRTSVLEGPQDRFPGPGDLLEVPTAVDARGATWTVPAGEAGAERYPVAFVRTTGGHCLVGGHVRLEHDHDATTWSEWHDVGGAVTIGVPGVTLAGTTIENVGDGVAVAAGGADWTMRDVLVRGAHDDCVQNDDMESGRIERSYFDGCFGFYSSTGPPGSRLDGSGATVTITDSLVRMKAMPHPFRPDRYGPVGHSTVFKLGQPTDTGHAPRLSVHDTVFLLNEAPANRSPDAPTYDHDGDSSTPERPYLEDCSGNTIVWTGDGPFPGRWPDCFEVTTDPQVWEAALARWEEATGRDVPGGRAG